MTDTPAPSTYAAFPVATGGTLRDVRLEGGGRVWHLAGRGGPEAERQQALRALADGGMPVFVGGASGPDWPPSRKPAPARSSFWTANRPLTP